MGLGFGCWSTGVLEDVTCRASRVGDRIAAKSKSFTLDQRRTGQTERGVHFSPRTSMESFLVGPGLLESSERTARCGCGAM